MNFSGSYRQGDVVFLLKRLSKLLFMNVADKEQLIQSGTRHYSEMLSPEVLPSPHYLALFHAAFFAHRQKMAHDCLVLAALIATKRNGPITLVSLVRAGTPIGVILKNLLNRVFERDVVHYSISIVRDRGIDTVALQHILTEGHSPGSIVFVDGWTGKGVISHVLEVAVDSFNRNHSVAIDKGLYVLVDLAGTAFCAASSSDYLIPSSILNSTVSGLVSRSVLNDSIAVDDFHGCIYYEEFAESDFSQKFTDIVISEGVLQAERDGLPVAVPVDRHKMAEISTHFLKTTMERYHISDVNLVKPGIGEATRVLLRRAPGLLILRDENAVDVAHLKILAHEKSVPIVEDVNLPYQAVSLIRSALNA